MNPLAKHIFCFLVLFSGLVTLATAQRIPFPITFENETPSETRRFLFTFTGDPYGSDSVDSQLGEREIPNIPLPGNIFYVHTVAPIQSPTWLSPNEVRRVKSSDTTLVVFDVRVSWNGGKLKLIWRQPIPSQIDSIWITDGFSDWPNNFLKQKVVPGTTFDTDNPAITRLRVMIWYNGSPTSVEERATENVTLAPNPTADVCTITNVAGRVHHVGVYDVCGREMIRLGEQYHDNQPLSLDVSGLKRGLYFVNITYADGYQTSVPLVRE